MTDGGRFGFEDDDDGVPPEPGPDATDGPITGTDPAGAVLITVNESADVLSVRLADDWKSAVEPRALQSSVLTAMNAATALALGRQVERAEESPGTDVPPGTSQPPQDDRPITKQDALRLLDEVTSDLERFMQQLSAISDQVVSTQSAGRHVRVSGKQRQVTEVDLDPSWVTAVPDGEIESELRDALVSFSQKSSVGELAQGPQSLAISELQSLIANPHETVRRINQSGS